MGVAKVSGSRQEKVSFDKTLPSLLSLQAYNRCEFTGGVSYISRKMENGTYNRIILRFLYLFFTLVLHNMKSRNELQPAQPGVPLLKEELKIA